MTVLVALLLEVFDGVADYGRTGVLRWRCARDGSHRDWRSLVRDGDELVLCRRCGRRWERPSRGLR